MPSPSRRRRVQQKGTILTINDNLVVSTAPPTVPTTSPAASSTAPAPTTFAGLGARPETVAALAAVGITTPFAIQSLALPIALGGSDVTGQARTGTGKTLAFGVPLLQRIAAPADEAPGDGRPQALVVVPTRELCIQVTQDLAVAGDTRDVRVLSIYGGRSYDPQVEALRRGVDIVVGTPGRLLDLAAQRHLDLGAIRALVLDEADEMLDLGFLPDVERILALTPTDRQTMLFSATMPGPIVTLARRFLRRPTHVRAEDPGENRTVPTTSQHVFRAHAMDKAEMLARILQAEGRGLTIVFCRTKRTCDKVAEDLLQRGFAAAAVHGDLGQGQREQALRAFRSGKIDVLVATDVAARGIDVTGVTHVVNYQCPEDEKDYLHRIGRTGRAGGSGTAVTFVDWDDLPRWSLINAALELPFPDPAETYSSSPHLYESLDIPRSASGRLPRDQRVRAGLDAERLEDLGETGGRRRRRPGRRVDGPDGGGNTDATTKPPGRPRARRRTRGAGAAASAAVTRTTAGVGAIAENASAAGAEAAGVIGPEAAGVIGPEGAGVAGPRVHPAAGADSSRRRRRRGGRGRGRTGAPAQDAMPAGVDPAGGE